ncbi:hypothetical protein JW711_03125 [Candidatus Woesearchaeota archaeon]|nr:hypothetical protein [Candidatus Woesearchaeota archaeon]
MDPTSFEEIMRQQNMMLRSVAQESETDNKIKILDIVNNLVGAKNKKIQKEAVLIEAQGEGMLADESERILDGLIDDRVLEEPEPGFVKRA